MTEAKMSSSATNRLDDSVHVGPVDLGSGRQSGEIRKLTSLVEISQALASAMQFKASLHRVLEILEKSHDAVRSAVALSADDGTLQVAAAVGTGRDRSWHSGVPGGALARQVLSSGRPVVVPRVSGEAAPGGGRARAAARPLAAPAAVVPAR